MFSNKIPERRLAAWIFVAASAPAAGIYGGKWLGISLLALLCAAAGFSVQKLCSPEPPSGRVICGLQWLWLGILLGNLAGYSATCWEPMSKAVPLTLLALASFGASKGGEQASRGGAFLFWLVIGGLAVTLGAGAKQLHTEWMMPDLTEPEMLLVPILLLPCITVMLPRRSSKCAGWNCVAAGLPAAVFSLWLNGTLSPVVAASVPDPFYEYSKSLSLLGIAQRFEALVSCLITAGWFSLFLLLLSAAGEQAEQIQKKRGTVGVWCCAGIAAAVYLSGLRLDGRVIAALTAFFWCVLPAAQSARNRKKGGKK